MGEGRGVFCEAPALLLQVTEHAVVSGDEITAVVAFETFLDLLEVPASWMGAFFPALVKLSVETASNTQLELNTREQALQVSQIHTDAFRMCMSLQSGSCKALWYQRANTSKRCSMHTHGKDVVRKYMEKM